MSLKYTEDDINKISKAWLKAGTPAVAQVIGISIVKARMLVCSLKKRHPELFPRKKNKNSLSLKYSEEDLLRWSKAWNEGGSPALAEVIGTNAHLASTFAGNLRRSRPDLFQRKMKGYKRNKKTIIRDIKRLLANYQDGETKDLIMACVYELASKPKPLEGHIMPLTLFL